MKNAKFIIIVAVLLTLTGCTATEQKETVNTTEPVKRVKAEELQTKVYPKSITYLGHITSEKIKAYSFKSGGKIEKIHVEVGDKVQKGDPIAALKTDDLIFQRDAAKKQMEAAKAQYDQALNGAPAEDIKNAELDVALAQKAYNFALQNYEDISNLYHTGAASKNDLDQVTINKDQAYLRLEQAKQVLTKAKSGARSEEIEGAKAQYEAAQVQYEANASLLADATIYADIDGYVAEVENEAGEMIGAGYPVVLVRNDVQIVELGVTQEDVKKLQIGTPANITIDDIQTTGTITKINQIPDTSTKTYTVQLQIEENLSSQDFYLGSTAKASFHLENVEGIWIDLLSILNDGEDYVYVVKDNRAMKKNIEIQQLYEDKVLVTGLQAGEKMVVDGMKAIKEGYMVEIIQ